MTIFALTGLDRFNPVQGGARGMRVAATGLLLLMAATYLVARHFSTGHDGWSFVRAFAEAAMVGGLADWFAVTALFRHPLGLPIPHTAIIPRNKDRIGDSLATFLRDNFLIPAVVARRMMRVDAATAAGRFLSQPPSEGSRLREGASKLFAAMLESLDDERLGAMVKGAIAGRLRALDVSPLLGQALTAAIREDRHVPLLDAIVVWASRTLRANETLIREMVHERAGAILRWTGLDERLANAVIDGLDRLLAEMAADPGHPLRAKAEEGLAKLAADLQTRPETRARVERLKEEILANPAVARWIEGLWQAGRDGLLRAARDPRAAMAGRLGEALRQLGAALQSDPQLGRALNRFLRRMAVGMAASYGDAIVRLVSDTVRGWDARTVTGRLEAAVGRDLQYIRINGTVVGGLVGLGLHLIDVFG
ncbi:MAG TPA: DUF445 domain-containing protein [Sphingomonadaceae bacterium]|nr:DUF445 domain-containing protein [Sphingomonadaceae bacterium]